MAGSLAGLAFIFFFFFFFFFFAKLTVDKQNDRESYLCRETNKRSEKGLQSVPNPLSLGKHMAGCSTCFRPHEGPMIYTLSNHTRCPWCHNNRSPLASAACVFCPSRPLSTPGWRPVNPPPVCPSAEHVSPSSPLPPALPFSNTRTWKNEHWGPAPPTTWARCSEGSSRTGWFHFWTAPSNWFDGKGWDQGLGQTLRAGWPTLVQCFQFFA